MDAVIFTINRPLWSGYEYPWLFKTTMDFLTWCTSMVVRCEKWVSVICRNASSSVSVSEGMSCCTDNREVIGEEGLGGILPEAAGARRPPLPSLAPRAGLPCPRPFLRIGIHALSILSRELLLVDVLCCAIVDVY